MTPRRRARRDDGSTTVEFALVLPIFVVLIGIATYFAWMFYVQAQVNRAADRAARYAAVPYVTTTTVSKNVDANGNVYAAGATIAAGTTIVGAYQTTQTTTTYNFCETQIVNKINDDLFSGSVAVPTGTDPTTYDVQVSDGTTSAAATPSHVSGPIPVTQTCQRPVSYVKVQISKDFTNPFSYLLAPFTGTTSRLTVTGTGESRVESP